MITYRVTVGNDTLGVFSQISKSFLRRLTGKFGRFVQVVTVISL